MRIFVLNGPNLNLLGTREPDFYGHFSIADYKAQLEAAAASSEIVFRQTNSESELIEWVQEASAARCNVILNPAAFTHYSYALRDAVAHLVSLGGKLIEVHISNPNSREDFRRHSVISPVATGVIAGFGVQSYLLALNYLLEH
jgi:3-dehydroquinate dehydratase-2